MPLQRRSCRSPLPTAVSMRLRRRRRLSNDGGQILSAWSVPASPTHCVGPRSESETVEDAIEDLLLLSRIGDLGSDRSLSELVGEPAAGQVVGASCGHSTRLRAPCGAVYTLCVGSRDQREAAARE